MTVSTEVNQEGYTGNGVTTTFGYRFRILKADNLTVTRIDASGVETVLLLGTDYAVTGAGSYSGGNVVLNAALPNGLTLTIERNLAIVQETDLRNQGTFFAEVHEDVFDYITMILQQLRRLLSLTLSRATFKSKFFDAKNYPISNLGEPSKPQDATTKNYVDVNIQSSRTDGKNYTDQQVASEAEQRIAADNALSDRIIKQGINIQTQLKAVLRVPEAEVDLIQPSSVRAESLFGWGTYGQPVSIFTWTATADLAIKLASNHGGSYVGTESGKTVQQELDSFKSVVPDGPESNIATRGQYDIKPSYSNLWGVAGLNFGGDSNSGQLLIDDKGRIKTSAAVGGVQTGAQLMFPTVETLGTFDDTTLGRFYHKTVRFPSHGHESDQTSPSAIFHYTPAGAPMLAIVNPLQFSPGNFGFPITGGLGTYYREVAFADQFSNYSVNTRLQPNASLGTWTPVATWNLSSIPYNTELKFRLTSSNTGDRFVGSVIVEANIQASGVTLATPANITTANISKFIRVKHDSLADRVFSENAVPRVGVTLSGTTLTLHVYLPAGQSSSFITPIAIGFGTQITTAFGATPVTAAPSGIAYASPIMDWNGANSSMSNDGSLIMADVHVRVCGSNGSSSRSDITQGGFNWSGYGTAKSFRETCTISRSSTGVYVISGPHITGSSWKLRQPRDSNGEQVAIARLTNSSPDGLTNTISIYAINYVVDTTPTPPTVTYGIGAPMDLPDGTWVDFHGLTTF
ncbi:hypothetical protein LLS47_12340 [Rouxiella badensis]|uniref:hypothetical protein n=1 Tax=Rouxiella badensis TaxID=1646377 RepID=UPI001D159707|nr:hypothetical protein [Rouxiella badensis]MCC3733717.1 hypothetical protein [Rouxiella badensis]MCC3759630.1 hypothetical protein [Rouxiella badensis]